MSSLSPVLGCLGALPASHAQQPAKVFRIGFLGSGSPAATEPRLEAFRQGLRDLGYIEGRTIAIEYRWAEGKMERLPALAAEPDLPVEQPTKFELVVNLGTARSLGLTIPQPILLRANETIN